MTEGEWLACTDPEAMLEFMRGKASGRKLRLFAVACCRRIWELLTDKRSRKAVELAEQVADHPISPHMLDAVSGEAEEAFEDAISPDEASTVESREKTGAACSAASYASNSPVVRHSDAVEVMQSAADAASDSAAERAAQATLVHELWVYPFRPITLNPGWLTPTVKQLAVTVYDDRAFDRLPILADALEEKRKPVSTEPSTPLLGDKPRRVGERGNGACRVTTVFGVCAGGAGWLPRLQIEATPIL